MAIPVIDDQLTGLELARADCFTTFRGGKGKVSVWLKGLYSSAPAHEYGPAGCGGAWSSETLGNRGTTGSSE